jgi:hypothetical protein
MRTRHSNVLAEAHFLRTKAEPRLVSGVAVSLQNYCGSPFDQFYKPWELRPEEDDRIKRQIEDAEKTIETEVDEHQAKESSSMEENKAEEVQASHSSASQIDRAEPSNQPEDQDDIKQDDEQSRAEPVGTDTTNDEQVAADKSTHEVEIAGNKDKPEVEATVREEDTGKPEEKTNEDHGGEELVEGQEDDVIY